MFALPDAVRPNCSHPDSLTHFCTPSDDAQTIRRQSPIRSHRSRRTLLSSPHPPAPAVPHIPCSLACTCTAPTRARLMPSPRHLAAHLSGPITRILRSSSMPRAGHAYGSSPAPPRPCQLVPAHPFHALREQPGVNAALRPGRTTPPQPHSLPLAPVRRPTAVASHGGRRAASRTRAHAIAPQRMQVGLGVACAYARSCGPERTWHRIRTLAAALRLRLRGIPAVTVHDRGAVLCGIVSFSLVRPPPPSPRGGTVARDLRRSPSIPCPPAERMRRVHTPRSALAGRWARTASAPSPARSTCDHAGPERGARESSSHARIA